MIEKTLMIPTSVGFMETFVTHPEKSSPFSAIVLYMDVWGLREELFDMAKRIAGAGYYCLVPDLYYRFGRIRHAFRNDKNQMISMELLEPHQQEAVRIPMRQLTDLMVVEDTEALLRFIDRTEPVKPGAMGSIGYCMGGRHVFRVAGAYPERFRANACLHGTRLVTPGEDSPHRSAMKAEGELYCGFAEKDVFASIQDVDTIAQSMKGAKARYQYELHLGADHGYALPDRDIYHKSAAERDWQLMFAMWQRQLGAC
jgi:carboxymethylenebutenolidase